VGFFDDLKAKATELSTQMTNEIKKYANKSFHEAIVAACSVIAVADGTISKEEKAKMMGFMDMNETMKLFDKNKTIQIFSKYSEQMDFDVDLGRNEALSVIGKLAGKPNEARAIMRLACAIGAADGDFDADEKAAARQICQTLNLDPAEFDL
jgi:tellurite resistance protein TerB